MDAAAVAMQHNADKIQRIQKILLQNLNAVSQTLMLPAAGWVTGRLFGFKQVK